MAKEMRFMAGQQGGWNGQSPLAGSIMRALQETGTWSIDAMRAPGIRLMESLEDKPQFRAAAPLPEKAQVVIDNALVEVGLQRLTLVQDILDAGLTYPLTDPLAVPYLEWYSSNRTGAAQRTMTPAARGENKMPIMTPNRLPIYLTTDRFEIDIRTLKMSQRVGMPIDTTLAKQCMRAVNEAIEDAAINGATTLDGQDMKVGGYSAPGILNAPGAETQALTAAAWSPAHPVGSTIFAQVQSMISLLQGNRKYGPYRLYVGTGISNALDGDYSTSTNQITTIRQRLLQIESLQAIRTADLMPGGTAVTDPIGAKIALVQMTSDVIDIVDGQRPVVIPWTSLDGMVFTNLVMAIMIPRVRSDYDGNSGIAIGTTA